MEAKIALEKPDIAFSFLASDEALAIRLSEKLRQHVRTFVYSEKQKEIAGRDGVEIFTGLYSEQAQFVVVLYREIYGSTKWTRLEQEAIKSRVQELGLHTVFLISLDGKKPAWLSPSRLYFGLEQFGEDVAAEAILGRFMELGLQPRPETFAERAQRRAADLNAASKAKLWRQSQQGVDDLNEEFQRFGAILQDRVDSIPDTFQPELVDEDGVFGKQVRIAGARVTFQWVRAWGNTLEDSELAIYEYQWETPEGGWGRGNWRTVKHSAAEPHLDTRSATIEWLVDRKGDLRSTEALVDFYLDRLLERHGGRFTRRSREDD